LNKPRLTQLIKKAGLAKTKSDAEQMIHDGRVKVDGTVVKNISFQTRPSTHVITIDNKPLKLVEEKLYFLLNKPLNYSSQKGEKGKRSVIDLFDMGDERLKNTLFPVGRLDYNTTGLMIITNDGALVHKILNPAREVWKTYFIRTNKEIPKGGIEKIKKGINCEINRKKYTCLPAKIKQLDIYKYELQIREGKKRQIREMIKATGCRVLELHRQAIGKLKLPDDIDFSEYKAVTKEKILSAL